MMSSFFLDAPFFKISSVNTKTQSRRFKFLRSKERFSKINQFSRRISVDGGRNRRYMYNAAFTGANNETCVTRELTMCVCLSFRSLTFCFKAREV